MGWRVGNYSAPIRLYAHTLGLSALGLRLPWAAPREEILSSGLAGQAAWSRHPLIVTDGQWAQQAIVSPLAALAVGIPALICLVRGSEAIYTSAASRDITICKAPPLLSGQFIPEHVAFAQTVVASAV